MQTTLKGTDIFVCTSEQNIGLAYPPKNDFMVFHTVNTVKSAYQKNHFLISQPKHML